MATNPQKTQPEVQAEEEPDPIAELITTYYEQNGCAVEELDSEPSPLEFMRFVARNSPFVVRGAAADWGAVRAWDAAFLAEYLRDEVVNVAVTPGGNADAPTQYGNDGELVLAKPCEENQPFPEFLAYLIQQEQEDPSFPPDAEVRYAQTQNNNLHTEYASLLSLPGPAAVGRDIPFARVALGRAPEAVNLWVGGSRSVTALHRDGYENVYVQLRGRKHFVLLPPACQPCVGERHLRGARYFRTATTGGGGGGGSLKLRLDEEGEEGEVCFATWDPDYPAENATPYSGLARPLRVTLDPGDMLYLPAMWYHKVSQSCAEDGIVVAVNYWYDMDYNTPLYQLSTFVRSVDRSMNGASRIDE